jgi:hypothetical protein
MLNLQTARTIEGESVDVHNGLVGMVRANTAGLHFGTAGALIAQQDAALTMGGAQVILAGKDATLKQGGGQVMLVGGNATLQQSGAGALAAGQATVRRSLVGFVLAGQVDIAEDSRILFGTPQAIAFGLVVGLFLMIGRALFRSGRAGSAPAPDPGMSAPPDED